MITLVPSWAHNYEEFWIAIRRRNLWFIQLRYFAVFLLAAFFLIGEFFLDFRLSTTQLWGIFLSAGAILTYNLIIHYLRKFVSTVPGRFNVLHLSLLQTFLDLLAVLLLIFFTGIIYSPFLVFFIFQLIIGSLILPSRVIYTIAVVLSVILSCMIFGQHFGALPTFEIKGIFQKLFTENFIAALITALSVTFISISVVYLTNAIARRLYQRESELKESLDKIHELEITKQKYIMGVVHELKSPISAVQSILELILGGFVGDISDEVKDKIERASYRAAESINLINNVLRISKIRLLNITNPEKILIEKLIKEQVLKFLDSASQHNIIINIFDKRELKKSIYTDRMLLELVISNLIGNAIKYGHDGGNVEITLKESGEYLLIKIADDGKGIPRQDISKIFNQFYRSKNIQSTQIEGSGIGLSVVKEIIERIGGKISVESPSDIGNSDNPGSAFYVYIPYGSEEPTLEQEGKESDLLIGREI